MKNEDQPVKMKKYRVIGKRDGKEVTVTMSAGSVLDLYEKAKKKGIRVTSTVGLKEDLASLGKVADAAHSNKTKKYSVSGKRDGKPVTAQIAATNLQDANKKAMKMGITNIASTRLKEDTNMFIESIVNKDFVELKKLVAESLQEKVGDILVQLKENMDITDKEQLDEISKETLKSYAKMSKEHVFSGGKKEADLENDSRSAGSLAARHGSYDDKISDNINKKIRKNRNQLVKRSIGHDKAVDKLADEKTYHVSGSKDGKEMKVNIPAKSSEEAKEKAAKKGMKNIEVRLKD